MNNTVMNASKPGYKKEAPKPVIDEKKEKMKNALFSGISDAKKDSDSDSEEEKKKPEPEKKAEEVDLLNFDMGGS